MYQIEFSLLNVDLKQEVYSNFKYTEIKAKAVPLHAKKALGGEKI
jgi:hypothetical protein